jgi:hypothetical protein
VWECACCLCYEIMHGRMANVHRRSMLVPQGPGSLVDGTEDKNSERWKSCAVPLSGHSKTVSAQTWLCSEVRPGTTRVNAVAHGGHRKFSSSNKTSC